MESREELALLNQIVDEIIVVLQEIISSGEELSVEVEQLLISEIEWIVTRMQELQSQAPSEGMQPSSKQEQFPPSPFPSSNVAAFKYDPKTQKLLVRFHGKEPSDVGSVYGYDGVPQNIYDVFSRGGVAPRTSGQNRYHRWIKGVTPSLGASLYALIREGGYPYRRMS